MLDYLWDRTPLLEDHSNSLVILGQVYEPAMQKSHDCKANMQPASPNPNFTDNLNSVLQMLHIDTADACSQKEWPQEFLDDLYTRVWFTYRTGFHLIPRDKNGPSPLNLGALLRGTLDISNSSRGFTTDAGWGCMIRTSQSLLANALIELNLGRNWRCKTNPLSSDDNKTQWKCVKKFVDVPSEDYSIFKFVDYAAKNCDKKPGEWFGPSDAAKSIYGLCKENGNKDTLVYLTSASGDIYNDDLLNLATGNNTHPFKPTLILSGVRLGVKSVNSIYWPFLKLMLSIPQSVGIAGGRPSSSYYFFGYQGDYLFYLDPHTPQKSFEACNEPFTEAEIDTYISTIHTSKIKKLKLDQLDPSMLIGLLVKNENDYSDLKRRIEQFDQTKRCLNVYEKRLLSAPRSFTGIHTHDALQFADEDDDKFVEDLGVESLNENFSDYEEDDNNFGSTELENEEEPIVVIGNENEEQEIVLTKSSGCEEGINTGCHAAKAIISEEHEQDEDVVHVPYIVKEDPNANEMACDNAVDFTEVVIQHDRKYSAAVLITPTDLVETSPTKYL